MAHSRHVKVTFIAHCISTLGGFTKNALFLPVIVISATALCSVSHAMIIAPKNCAFHISNSEDIKNIGFEDWQREADIPARYERVSAWGASELAQLQPLKDVLDKRNVFEHTSLRIVVERNRLTIALKIGNVEKLNTSIGGPDSSFSFLTNSQSHAVEYKDPATGSHFILEFATKRYSEYDKMQAVVIWEKNKAGAWVRVLFAINEGLRL
jgi:hypothetical protein